MMLILVAFFLGLITLGIAIYIQHRVNGVGLGEKTIGTTTAKNGLKGKIVDIGSNATMKRVGLVLTLWIVCNALLWMILPDVMSWWQGRGASFFLGTEVAIMILFYLMVAFKDTEDKDKPGIKTVQRALVGLLLVGLLVPPVVNWWNEPDDPPPAPAPTVKSGSSDITTFTAVPKAIQGIGEKMLDFVNGTSSTGKSIRKYLKLNTGDYLKIPINGPKGMLKGIWLDTREGRVYVTSPDGQNFSDFLGNTEPIPDLVLNGLDKNSEFLIKPTGDKVAKFWLTLEFK